VHVSEVANVCQEAVLQRPSAASARQNNITTTQLLCTHLLLNLLHGYREEVSPSVRTNCPPLGVSHGRKEERGYAWSRLHAPPPHRPCTHTHTHRHTNLKSRLNKVSGGVADD
jgi:hypothetical protein